MLPCSREESVVREDIWGHHAFSSRLSRRNFSLTCFPSLNKRADIFRRAPPLALRRECIVAGGTFGGATPRVFSSLRPALGLSKQRSLLSAQSSGRVKPQNCTCASESVRVGGDFCASGSKVVNRVQSRSMAPRRDGDAAMAACTVSLKDHSVCSVEPLEPARCK